jgi:hypothetical protein
MSNVVLLGGIRAKNLTRYLSLGISTLVQVRTGVIRHELKHGSQQEGLRQKGNIGWAEVGLVRTHEDAGDGARVLHHLHTGCLVDRCRVPLW